MTFLVTSPPSPGDKLWPCQLPHVADLNKGRCSFNYPGRKKGVMVMMKTIIGKVNAVIVYPCSLERVF